MTTATPTAITITDPTPESLSADEDAGEVTVSVFLPSPVESAGLLSSGSVDSDSGRLDSTVFASAS